MAVEKQFSLCQGNCKNAFCQAILPSEEVTIVHPPSGDPDANPHKYWLLKQTLYALQCRLLHWCHKINAILWSIGLTPSLEDPCLYSGFIVDPPHPSGTQSDSPLSLGLYVDDFVYFPKIQQLKLFSVGFLLNASRSTLWAL
jgi:hypothetical protein